MRSLLRSILIITAAAALIWAPACPRLHAQDGGAAPAGASSGSHAPSAADLLPNAPQSQADRPATVNGTVTDTSGDLIPGADIVIDGPSPADHRAAVANDHGAFQFDNLMPGTA